jgi:hypothetical protein
MLDLVTPSMGLSGSNYGLLRYKMPRDRINATVSRGRSLNLDARAGLPSSRAAATDTLAKQFRKHEQKWKRETRHVSSPTDKYLHTSYARIIGMGKPAASLILGSLRREPDDWFYALRAVTGANPVTAAMAGDMKRMTAAWLHWGRQEGLC